VVAGTTWAPRYDLHVSAVDGEPSSTVSLHYGARISQNTGEDWIGAVLTLCTSHAPAKVSSNIPVLKARKIVVKGVASDSSKSDRPGPFWNRIPTNTGTLGADALLFGSSAAAVPPPRFSAPLPAAAAQQAMPNITVQPPTRTWLPEAANASESRPRSRSPSQSRSPILVHDRRNIVDMTGGHNDHAGTVPELEVSGEGASTVVRESLHSETLQVNPETLNLPSNGVAHNVPIAVFELGAQFTWVCVPRVRSAAYVECRVTNKSATRFRPGPVNVYVGESFTARTDMQDTRPNSTFTCSLGMDNALQVAYKRTAVTKADPPHPFAERSKTTKCAVHIRVVNNHPFRLSLRIRDVAPLAHDGRVIGALVSGDTVHDARGVQQGFSPQREIVGSKPTVRWLGDAVDHSEGEENGLYEWKCQLVPGSVTVVTEWEVQTAANISWEEAEQ